LLLNGDGTNGAQNNTFLDSSTNNFSITRNGNTTQGSFSPYGTLWSNFFNGSNSYLSVPDNAALELGTANFTMEAFVYPTSFANTGVIFSKMPNSGTAAGFLIQSNSSTGITKLYVSSNGSSWDIVSDVGSIALTLNFWNHVAVARSGSSFRIWVNGTSSGTATSSGSVQNNSAPVFIGAAGQSSTTNYIAGYVSQARIVNGTDVYGVSNSTITVPTTPLTAITNTALLTCADNRFIDDSTNNFTITPVGSLSVQRFSPFNPTAPYSTSVIGGSGYFDGTGDYLNAANNSAFAFGTGDFTMECWYYSGVTGQQSVLDTRTTGNGPGVLMYTLNNRLRVYANGGDAAGSLNIPNNSWTHLVVERISGALFTYVNGVRDINGSSFTANLTDNSFVAGFDTKFGGFGVNGYLANMRVVNGTGIYTGASFTLPTAPLTAVSGTSVLLNTINAGIPDLAMQNNLETVGNAQVSTAQSKFGGSSLFFDGSGDALFMPSANQSFSLGATFTVEFWLYNTMTSGFGGVIGQTGTNWYTGIPITYVGGGASTFSLNSYAGSLTVSGLSNSTWYHVAIVSLNNVATMYINGNPVSGPLSQAVTGTPAYVTIGKHDGTNGIGDFSGFIDDLRITKGIARYVSSFTPPTIALPTY
jgi:hypothetical protein